MRLTISCKSKLVVTVVMCSAFIKLITFINLFFLIIYLNVPKPLNTPERICKHMHGCMARVRPWTP
jgi:hypothetical protein